MYTLDPQMVTLMPLLPRRGKQQLQSCSSKTSERTTLTLLCTSQSLWQVGVLVCVECVCVCILMCLCACDHTLKCSWRIKKSVCMCKLIIISDRARITSLRPHMHSRPREQAHLNYSLQRFAWVCIQTAACMCGHLSVYDLYTHAHSGNDIDTLEQTTGGLKKYFKLESSAAVTNMTMFDQAGSWTLYLPTKQFSICVHVYLPVYVPIYMYVLQAREQRCCHQHDHVRPSRFVVLTDGLVYSWYTV